MTPLGIVMVLILLPLAPAYVLYKGLSGQEDPNSATGKWKIPWLSGAEVSFSVVGSTSVYMLILAIAFGIYHYTYQAKLKLYESAEKQAFTVKLPLRFRAESDGSSLGKKGDGRDFVLAKLVKVSTNPRSETLEGDILRFKVIPTGRDGENMEFPSIELSVGNSVAFPTQYILSDKDKFEVNLDSRTITSVGPVWVDFAKRAEYAIPSNN